MNMTKDADFLSMFMSEGVSPSQVQIIPSSYNINDLISGKLMPSTPTPPMSRIS